MKIRAWPVLTVFIAGFLCSCGSYYHMNVKEGSFGVFVPPPVYGASMPLDRWTEESRLKVNLSGGESSHIRLQDIWNDFEPDLPREQADIEYFLRTFPITASYEYLSKRKSLLWSAGAGLNPFPYGSLTLGFNSAWLEAGLSASLGAAVDRASYEGGYYYSRSTFDGSMDDYGYGSGHGSLHFQGGAGGYASAFVRNFAFTYAPMIVKPWWTSSLSIDAPGSDYYDVSITFPFIVTQYFGVTYNFRKRIQFSVGATQVSGEHFSGRYWFGESSAAFLF